MRADLMERLESRVFEVLQGQPVTVIPEPDGSLTVSVAAGWEDDAEQDLRANRFSVREIRRDDSETVFEVRPLIPQG